MKTIKKIYQKIYGLYMKVFNFYVKRGVIPTLLLLLLLGFVVRLYKIDNPVADWHSWRQADTASVTEIFAKDGIDLLHPRYYDISVIQTGFRNPDGWRFVEFPIYNAVTVLAYNAAPQFSLELWGRLISIGSTILGAAFLYGLGRRTISRWGGIVAAFFMLFIPYNVYFTRVILPEPMGVMFVTGFLFFFFEYMNSNKKSHLFLSASMFAAAMLIKPFAIFYALPVAYFVYKKYGIKKVFKNIPLLLALDIALIPFLLWRAWMSEFPYFLGIPHFSWAFNGDGIRFRPAFWRWIFGERLGKLILGDWGLFPFLIGVCVATKKNIGLVLSLVGMFLFVSTVATASVRHDYYQAFAIPAICWALAQGVTYLWTQKDFAKWPTRFLTCFSICMMFLMGWYPIKELYVVNHYEIVLAGQEANKILPKDAKVIAPYNGDTAFLYQIKRFGWPIVDRSIEEMMAHGAQYFVSVNKADPDDINFRKRFKVLVDTDRFTIIDLTQKIN